MITDLKPYPEMKESGIDVLGAVPAHWEIVKLGQIGRLSKGNGGSKEDEVATGHPCVRYGDLYTRHTFFIHNSRACISEAKAGDYTRIERGDILFAASGETIEEIGKSAVNLIEGEAYCGGDVIIFRPNQPVDSRYLGYATDFRPAAVQKARMGRGFTVVHIYGDGLKHLAVPRPPVPEQAGIARFLTHAQRRIGRYIQAKQKLITLLEEQKQVSINQAITGQIDVQTGTPYSVYRNSNVEWLGNIPVHWEVLALGQLVTKLGSGVTPRGGSTVYQEDGVPFLRSQNIHFHGLRLEGVARIPRKIHLAMAGTHVQPGDVLLNITGASIGRVCTVPTDFDEGNVNQHVCIVRPRRDRVESDFLSAFLSIPPLQREIRFEQNGASREGLTLDSIRSFRIALPPRGEQRSIVRTIRESTKSISAMSASARNQISLLEEYRTRLLSEVVTGKLDVRGIASTLPEIEADYAQTDLELAEI